MDPTMIVVIGIPLIIAIVSMLRGTFDINSRYLPLVSVLVGLALSMGEAIFVGSSVTSMTPMIVWTAAIKGIGMGLAASGLYDVGKSLSTTGM